MATTTGTSNVNVVNSRNSPSDNITPATPSANPRVNAGKVVTFNTVGGDQSNSAYQTSYSFNASQNKSSSSGITPSQSFCDAPLSLLSAIFTGRQNELAHMMRAFEVVRGDVPTRFGLYAGPGFGKSQLTLALAKESFAQGRYKYIFWIPATTTEKLYQGFSKLLHTVEHPDRFESEESIKLTAARRWLEDNTFGRWLLVLDNVVWDTINFLREHLPRKNNHGNILFTTRTEDLAMALVHTSGKHHEVFKLRLPNEEDATRLLLGHFRDGEFDREENKVQEIVKCVGCLPLAISQAAAYMRQTGSTLDVLLTIYNNEHQIYMLQWENDLSIYQEKSVAATFTYQLDDLQRQFPNVSNLLKILAYFDPEGMPFDMLTTGASVLSKLQRQTESISVAPVRQKRRFFIEKVKSKLRKTYKGKGKGQADETTIIHMVSAEMSSLLVLIQSPLGLPNAIAQLQNRSLIRRQRTGQLSSLWMHDFTQLIVRDNTRKRGIEREWLENAVELACSAFGQIPDPNLPEGWSQYEALIPHIQLLTIRRGITSNRSLLSANYRIAEYLTSRGRYNEAEALYRQVLSSEEMQLGPEHVDTLTTKHNLASVYESQGRYGDAELLYKQVLLSQEMQLGPEHIRTLTTKHNLASVLDSEGRYSEAEGLYRQILWSQEIQLGPGHVSTLTTKHNLAHVYEFQGRYSDAEALYLQVLSCDEMQLGPEHVDTLITKHNLASIYESQGRYNDAEVLYKHILSIKEKQFGPEHVSTLATKHSLANVYESQGLFSDAEVLYKQVLSGKEEHLGPEHVSTLTTKHSLALVYKSQGHYSDAETLYKQVLSSNENRLGPEHVDTLYTKHSLASVFKSQGRYAEAEELLLHVLAGYEKSLGLSHPKTQSSQRLLAGVYMKQGRFYEAARMTSSVMPSPPRHAAQYNSGKP